MLTDDQPAALRRRRARRARVTAALTTLPVAAAAIATSFAVQAAIVVAAVTILAGNALSPANPPPALDAVPASTILYTQVTWALQSVVTDRWASGQQMRTEVFSAGQLVSDSASTGTSTLTSVYVDYRDRTWSRSTGSVGPLSAKAPAVSCSNAGDRVQPIFSNPSWVAAEFRTLVSCGLLKADGTATAGGVTAIRLAMSGDGGYTAIWYVSPATYLPIRLTITRAGTGTLVLQADYQWLPPTTANLAKLNLPVPPAGFTQLLR